MMTVGEIVDQACSEAAMTDDESRAFALGQVDKWHRHICQQELWRELVGVIDMTQLIGLSTDGSYALPPGVDRVLAARMTGSRLVHRSISDFFQQEPWEFEKEGTPVSFTPLAPCVDRLIVDYAAARDINGVDRVASSGSPAIWYPNGLSGVSNTDWTGTMTWRATDNTIRTSTVTIGSIVSGASVSGYFLSTNTGVDIGTAKEIIAFSQSSAQNYPLRVAIHMATYHAIGTPAAMPHGVLIMPGDRAAKPRKWIHVGLAPDSVTNDNRALRLLIKREATPLANEGYVPDITGCENALAAFVRAALLRMDKRGDEANEALQEATALLLQLKQVAVAQEANHQQLIPADGIGNDWHGTPELWNSFKV